MLLDYTGGKTGKQYSFAVGYFPWDDGDVIVSSTAHWPKVMGAAERPVAHQAPVVRSARS